MLVEENALVRRARLNPLRRAEAIVLVDMVARLTPDDDTILQRCPLRCAAEGANWEYDGTKLINMRQRSKQPLVIKSATTICILMFVVLSQLTHAQPEPATVARRAAVHRRWFFLSSANIMGLPLTINDGWCFIHREVRTVLLGGPRRTCNMYPLLVPACRRTNLHQRTCRDDNSSYRTHTL